MTHPPIKYLQGEKVYLRPLEPHDVDKMYVSINNDLEMRRLTGTQRSFTRQQIEDYMAGLAGDSSRAQFAICVQGTDELIGDIALNNMYIRANRDANLRIAIFSEENCGKGYGSEAIRLLLDFGFGILNLHRIELEVYTINPRAYRAYEKVGFVQEGIKRKNYYYDHQYYDSIVMSILEDEYRELYKK
ncbi:MAG: GNAT family protein [Tumebacillaceae bacterium]